MRFDDRKDAGVRLAAALEAYRHTNPLVIGLARGGVVVAAAVASALDAELDALVVRKLGAPMQPELGLGAITEGGGRYLDARLVAATGTTPGELREVEAEERATLDHRIARYRAVAPRIPVAGRTVIVVDDGIATGGTARAALVALRREGPSKLVLAVPVAATQTLHDMRALSDEVVCLEPRDDLFAIGVWYRNFTQTSDDDVLALLARGGRARHAPAEPSRRSP